MSSPKNKFIKNQVIYLDEHNIVFYSIRIDLVFDDKNGKFKRNPYFPTNYNHRKLERFLDLSTDSTIIPLGKIYDGLICVEININIDILYGLANEYNCKLDTFTIDAIGGGKSLIFRLNDKQKISLMNFKIIRNLCVSTKNKNNSVELCIKYNNQITFGPAYYIKERHVRKMFISNYSKPSVFPNFLFKELLK